MLSIQFLVTICRNEVIAIFIYKITNIFNNKTYIGQTVRSVDARWQRHIKDATSGRLNTHLARAIRKYGAESFSVETIDEASDKEDLNAKEIFWINFYESNTDGYNMTIGGDNANTYANKSESELEEIKEKIRDSKAGSKNPNSRPCKCRNVLTHEELHFGTVKDCKEYFEEGNHNFIVRRCRHIINYLFRGEWQFAYEEEEYADYYTFYNRSRTGHRLRVINVNTSEIKDFCCYAEAERFLGEPAKYVSKKILKYGNRPWIKDNEYIIRAIG